MIKKEDLIDLLIKLASEYKSKYVNRYPYNLLYVYEDGSISADCLNLYKAIFNGWDIKKAKPGYYQRDLSKTGDTTEYGLLMKCTDRSRLFNRLKLGEFRLLYMPGHIAGYLGREYTWNGHLYNVVECTAAWQKGILFSWVDPDGTRRQYKDGPAKGKYTYHALPSSWVSDNVPASEAPKEDLIYIVQKGDCLSAIARKYGTTVAELARKNSIKNVNLIYTGQKLRI